MDNKSKIGSFRLEHWHFISILLVCFDVIMVNAAYYISLWLRFDCKFWDILPVYISVLKICAPIYALICVLVFLCCRMYNTIWRFAGIQELFLSILSTAITFALYIFLTLFVFKVQFPNEFVRRMPVSVYALGIILQFVFTVGARFSYKIYLTMRLKPSGSSVKRIMLIGAGAAGLMIIKDINTKNSDEKICCVIDDNPNKWNRYMDGVPVVGGRNEIFLNVQKFNIDKIILAIPSATDEEKRDILTICSETKCELKQVSLLFQVMGQKVNSSDITDVRIEDLLGRPSISTDMSEVYNFISGKTILVTGGGGSIGSELCRQIAAHRPKTLIIFDIYENNAYDIQLELKEKYPGLNLVTLIGSVRDSLRLVDVFSRYRPEIVFHAAAHKHVPLMEDSPCESIKNNVLGTYKTAYAAMAYGCKRFVLISTDKAVNPTNVMGASKRMCEMIIQSFNARIKEGKASGIHGLNIHGNKLPPLDDSVDTEFVAVRFGNVLGSNGSVIPIFKKQIAKGGPVTVTHQDVIRYFMTIPEAVSLVLQAGVYAHGGEIFVLDMGSPVKIDTLARNLIRLSGLRPDIDIKIEYTGLRPGEKLYEEKLMEAEGLEKTDNNLIYIGHPIDFDNNLFLDDLDDLAVKAYQNSQDIREDILHIVPTYKQINCPEKGRIGIK